MVKIFTTTCDISLFQVILDEAIVKLSPDYFWLGGGEVDLKLGIRTSKFINFVKPFIVSCSNWFYYSGIWGIFEYQSEVLGTNCPLTASFVGFLQSCEHACRISTWTAIRRTVLHKLFTLEAGINSRLIWSTSHHASIYLDPFEAAKVDFPYAGFWCCRLSTQASFETDHAINVTGSGRPISKWLETQTYEHWYTFTSGPNFITRMENPFREQHENWVETTIEGTILRRSKGMDLKILMYLRAGVMFNARIFVLSLSDGFSFWIGGLRWGCA